MPIVILLLLSGPSAFSRHSPTLPRARSAIAERSGGVTVKWIPLPGAPSRYEVEVSQIPPQIGTTSSQESPSANERWSRLLRVYAVPQGTAVTTNSPSMLGAYRIESARLRFTPAFPLEPGVSYVAIVNSTEASPEGKDRQQIFREFRIPEPKRSRTTVITSIYPSTQVLPENLLKFYLHFSAPMSRGHIYQFIHLRKEGGREIELPFLEIDEELWNPEMTRLTLFIDPGRIKRGVRPLEEIGPALEEGGRFELIIDRAWKDAAGMPLKAGMIKRFSIGPADRQPLNPKAWKITSPAEGTHDRLRIHFDESLDAALVQHCLEVIDTEGRTVQGEIRIGSEEREWDFRPARPWPRTEMAVKIRTTLEDLAGNNIGKAFDVDVFERTHPDVTAPSLLLPFTPSAVRTPDQRSAGRKHLSPARGE